MTSETMPVSFETLLHFRTDGTDLLAFLHRIREAKREFAGIEWSQSAPLVALGDQAAPHTFDWQAPALECGRPVLAVAAECAVAPLDDALAWLVPWIEKIGETDLRLLNLAVTARVRGDESESRFDYSKAFSFLRHLLRELRLAAESSGVIIGLDAGFDGFLASPAELVTLIDCANSWSVGACIDVERIEAFGCPMDWIHTLSHRLRAVRFSPNESRTSETILDVLNRANFDGWVIRR